MELDGEAPLDELLWRLTGDLLFEAFHGLVVRLLEGLVKLSVPKNRSDYVVLTRKNLPLQQLLCLRLPLPPGLAFFGKVGLDFGDPFLLCGSQLLA